MLGLEQLEFFCRECRILEPKIICVRKKSHTLRFAKGGRGLLVGWAHAAEGTGTRPDYLVNCDNQKNERPSGEKYCTEIEK